jgi:hypothetical protein
MTRQTFRAWCYLGTRAGQIENLAQDVLNHPEMDFMFADAGDKARIRRAIEDCLRKTATDRQLVEMARMLELI